jgi:hypothetical protein
MAFAVPVLKKDFDLYNGRRRSAPASTLNKMTNKNPTRRRVISATCASTRRPTVTASNDSVLSQSVDKRRVHFGVCHEIRYSTDDDNAEDEVVAEELGEEEDEDDSDFADSVDSGRSSLDSADENNSKERINDTPDSAQEPTKMPTSILRRGSQDMSRSPSPKTRAQHVQHRPTKVRAMFHFLVAKCAPKKN